MSTLVIGDSNSRFWSIINKHNFISVSACTLYSINKKKSSTNCNIITFTEIKKKNNSSIKNILLLYGINDLFLAYLKDFTNIDIYVKKVINEFITFKKKLTKLNKKLLFLDIIPMRNKQTCKLQIKFWYKNIIFNEKKFNIWYKNIPILRYKIMKGIKKHIKVISINKELSMLNDNKFYLGRVIYVPDGHIKHYIMALLLKRYNLYTPEEEKNITLKNFIKYDNKFYKIREGWKYKFKYTSPTNKSRKKLFKQLENILKNRKKI
jgi:hypothetical protein